MTKRTSALRDPDFDPAPIPSFEMEGPAEATLTITIFANFVPFYKKTQTPQKIAKTLHDQPLFPSFPSANLSTMHTPTAPPKRMPARFLTSLAAVLAAAV